MRGPVKFDGFAMTGGAQSVVTMELGQLIAKPHVSDLLHRPRSESISTGLLSRKDVFVNHDDVEALFGQPVSGRGSCWSGTDDKNVVVIVHDL
jgi:hypothetical protein